MRVHHHAHVTSHRSSRHLRSRRSGHRAQRHFHDAFHGRHKRTKRPSRRSLRKFFALLARYHARRLYRKGRRALSRGWKALRNFGARPSGANGRLPASSLVSIGVGGHRLIAPAARAFIAMRAAMARAGIHLGVTDSYRPYDVQVRLAKQKGLYSRGGLAATPGTSNHGWGKAVDVNTSAAGTAWLRAHAAAYGFHTIPREPWHWEFRG